MTKTVQEWVEDVLSSKEKMHHWLTRQYVGEVLASQRISSLAFMVTDPKNSNILSIIAEDEHRHAQWVKELLLARDIEPTEPTYDADRYWSKILSDDLTEQQLFAAGAHAEEMRLHRIRAIVKEPRFDQDIREVFGEILCDEVFHAKAFASMSGDDAIQEMSDKHKLGLEALGLEI